MHPGFRVSSILLYHIFNKYIYFYIYIPKTLPTLVNWESVVSFNPSVNRNVKDVITNGNDFYNSWVIANCPTALFNKCSPPRNGQLPDKLLQHCEEQAKKCWTWLFLLCSCAVEPQETADAGYLVHKQCTVEIQLVEQLRCGERFYGLKACITTEQEEGS